MTSPQSETDGRFRRGRKARGAILDLATKVASVHGLQGLTIGSLAADLGISKGNITVLFGDKESLQVHTLDRAVDVFVERVVRPQLTVASPLERLKGFCMAWFAYVSERVFPGGCMLYAATNEYRARPGLVQDRVNHHRRAWERLLSSTATAARSAGEIEASVDVPQLVFELMAFQASANVAAFLDDQKLFSRARRTTLSRLAPLPRSASPPSRRGKA